VVSGLLTGLSMELDVSRIGSLAEAGSVLAGFDHHVKARKHINVNIGSNEV